MIHMFAIVSFGCFKSRSGPSCIEGSGAAGLEGTGSREAWGSGAGEPCLCVQQVLAWVLQ
jgi:hypothetical protein